jgi:hypothetical protein
MSRCINNRQVLGSLAPRRLRLEAATLRPGTHSTNGGRRNVDGAIPIMRLNAREKAAASS